MGQSGGLLFLKCTLVELMVASGRYVDLLPNATARDHERRREESFLSLEPVADGIAERLADPDCPWTFRLSERPGLMIF